MLRRSKTTPLDVHLANLQASRKRWLSRLTRAANAIAKIESAIVRTERQLPKPEAPPSTMKEALAIVSAAKPVDLDIPTQFLRPKTNPADEAAKADIIAAKEAKTKAKAADKRAAKKDQLAKKPLTGKAALDFIHGK